MSSVSMRQMLEAGVHFGHQTRYWNPKMAPYIFGSRSKIHIVNLEKTLPLFQDALNFVGSLAAKKGTILFVGTKRAAREVVKAEASRAGMPYVNYRWLGGLLTNHRTIKKSIDRLRELESLVEDGGIERFSKREGQTLRRELFKLDRGVGGVKDMQGLPDALFIVDVGYEKIAVHEAVKLGIPIVGVVDSNNDPSLIDYVIPGNDDAVRAITLYASQIADAILEARSAAIDLAGPADEFVEVEETGAAEKPRARKKTAKVTAKRAKKTATKSTAKRPAEDASAAAEGAGPASESGEDQTPSSATG